jgi:hypothetical protein
MSVIYEPKGQEPETCNCEECGCSGNFSCGVKPLDEKNLCTLDRLLVCPCCNMVGVVENKKRWNNKGGFIKV